MAISGTSSVLTLISIIFLSITPSSTSNQITDTEIKHLCSKTSNLVQCFKLLKSDHRTSNVDAKGLSELSIDLTNNKANKIHSQLNSLVKATRDSHMRNRYNSCSKNYDDAIRDSLHKTMFITLLFAFAIPFSLGHRDDSDSETILRDLCSQIERSKECIDLIKSQLSRFEDSGCNNVAGPVIDNDASRNLEEAKRSFDSNDYQNIPKQVDDTEDELEGCRREFDESAFDPAHIRDRNKEFGLYVDLLKVAIDRLLQRNESDDGNHYYDGGYDYGWSYRN